MLKRLVVLLLGFIAGLAGNLLAGWVQQDVWTNMFTLPRLLWMGVGTGLVLLLLALLETERALAWNWWWHRFWYLLDVLHDPTLRRWETDFARLELAQGRRKGFGAAVIVEGERQDLVEVLRDGVAGRQGDTRRAFVLGEPGSGKTTGLERLTLDLARGAAKRLGLGRPVPVLARLGNFQEGNLLEYVGQEMLRGSQGRSGKALSKGIAELLERGRVVLLFDALDEALGARRETVLAELASLLAHRGYRKAPIVITSRTREDPGDRLGDLPVYEIQDLSDEAVAVFIHAYKEPDHKEEEIWERLERHRMLEPRGLGRNPFWLRLIVASGALQGSKGQILNQAVDTLLAREWDKPETRRAWQRVLGREEQLRETKQGLAWLGYRMTEARQVGLEQDRALGELKEWLQGRIAAEGLKAPDVLGLGRDAQILAYEPGPVHFRHRLLQEFMTAWALAEGLPYTADAYAALEERLQRLRAGLGWEHPRYAEALVYEQRLTENIAQTRRHGDTESRRAERSEIIAQLNTLALATLVVPFNELCHPAVSGEQDRVVSGELLEQYVQDADRWETLLLLAGLTRHHCALVLGVLADGQDARRLFLAIGLLWAVDEPDQELRLHVNVTFAGVLQQGVTEEHRRAAATVLARVGEEGVLKVAGELLERSEDQAVRQGAVEVIGELGSVRAARVLVGFCGDTTLAVTAILVNMGSVSVEPLIATLGNGREWVRQAAAEALVKIGEPAVEPLIAALGDEDQYVRQKVTQALGEIGDARAVKPLIATLTMSYAAGKALEKIGEAAVEPLTAALGDEDWRVRQKVAEALGKIGDARAVEPLIAALGDEHWWVRQNVAEALGEIGDARAVEPLIATLRTMGYVAARALGKIGDARAVEPLIAALGDDNRDVRQNVAEALGRIGEPAVEPLIAALEDDNRYVREATAEALGKIRDARAVEPLIAALGDEDQYVRRAVANALGKIGDARTVESLVAALGDKEVCREAAEALGKICDARAVEPLIAALALSDERVLRVAAEALGEIGDLAVEPLIAALGDEDWRVRWGAAVALGKIGDARAVEPLIAALGDDNRYVRQEAAEALGKIGDARAVEPLIAALGDDNRYVREAAAGALGKIGDARAVEPLVAALGDKDWGHGGLVVEEDMRQEAAGALGKIGDARAVEPLIAALLDRDEDEDVRRRAVEALGEIGDVRAVEPLIAALGDVDEDEDVRWRAVEALGEIGDVRAVEPLIAARWQWDEDEGLAGAVARALEKLRGGNK